jgi:hypothetical protein
VVYALVVKSVSRGWKPPSDACSQVQPPTVPYISIALSIAMTIRGEERDVPAGLAPQEQRSPAGTTFSTLARSQVQAPAGLAPIIHQHLSLAHCRRPGEVGEEAKEDNGIRHEQRGTVTAFSVTALAQLQCRADFSPQEHLAWVALWVN